STRIRTVEQRPLYVRNSVFSSIVVENPSRMFARRMFENIVIRHEDFAQMEAIIADINALLRTHDGIAQEWAPLAAFDAVVENGLKFFVSAYTRTQLWAEFQQVKQDVLLKVGNIINAHGAALAYPTRTVHAVDQSPERRP